jgi:hypothetical protein
MSEADKPKRQPKPKPKPKRKPNRHKHHEAPRFGSGATHSDRRLERQAIERGWTLAEAKKRAIIDRLCGVLDRRTSEGKNAKLRSVIMAAKTLMSADLRQQAINLQREIALGGGPAGTLADIVGPAEERANAHDAERERERSESTGPAH